ncbi:hypothetical protein FIE12Z_7352 [Fusarium flagelliforme]|uniref:Small secreted protein n=1 Tax=Fusarium flagelliforme TaxID=2675880 RepID=A0A395MKB6_9HYPO|nr:hypothetical protein FIE12Z_7352 [Fusarium flagelliforme]
MQFSIATVIAAMATFHTAAADWTVIAYSDSNCQMSGNGISRTLYSTQPVPESCFNFGEDMPNTSCYQSSSTSNSEGCVGALDPQSVYAAGNCLFYALPGCQGSEVGAELGITWRDTPTCVQGEPNYRCHCPGHIANFEKTD